MPTLYSCVVCLSLAISLCAPLNAYAADAAPPDAATAPAPEEANTEGDTWALAWENQSVYVQSIENSLNSLRESLPAMATAISVKLPTIESSAHGLVLLAEQYADNPMALGAVRKRYLVLRSELRRTLESARQARSQLDELLPKLGKFEETLSSASTSLDKTRNQEFAALLKQVHQLKRRLMETNTRLIGALTPGDFLEQRLNQATADFRKTMPERWLAYYLAQSRFFMPSAWESLNKDLTRKMEALQLRLSSELPQNKKAWLSVASRFGNIVVFGGLFLFLLRLRIRRSGETEYGHMLSNSLPWVCFGLAFFAAGYETADERYLGLLIPGTLTFTWGQISLAWDLRRVNFPGSPRISPMGSIFPLLAIGSFIILLDPPASVQSVLWPAALICAILIKRRRVLPETLPRLERGILYSELILIWLTLFISFFGWTRLSILCYLFFVTLVVGVNLAMGCITTLHKLSARIPEEGVASLLGGLLFGCAFPLVLALVAAGMLLCLIGCPGGPYLVLPYMGTSVNLGGVTIDLFLLLLILGAFYVTRALISAGKAFIRRLPESGLDPSLMTPLQAGFSYGLWMIFVLLILKVLGVDTEKLAIVAGGFSVGIGFGMQTIVNNLISGLILIFSRTLREGDVVEVGGLTGTVRTINIRATTVETFDNAIIFVPNSEFISTRLINWTRNSRMVRREITVSVATGTDPKLVQQLLLATAAGNPRVLDYPKPSALFVNFGVGTLDFSLRFWVNEYNDGMSISSELRGELTIAFALHKVNATFPLPEVQAPNAAPAQAPEAAPVAGKSARQSPPPARRRRGAARKSGHVAAAPEPPESGGAA